MNITRNTIERVINAYDYSELTKITTSKNGDISIRFECDRPQMDLIFSISAIVQDIISESGYEAYMADNANVKPSSKAITVTFSTKNF